MPKHLLLELSKAFFLTILLFTVIGCGNSNAKSAQSKLVISNVPVKAEKSVIKENNKSLPDKPEMTDANHKTEKKTEYGYRNGDNYLMQYKNNILVKQIILIEQTATEVSVGSLFLLIKNEDGKWQEVLRCKAYLGKNGIGKTKEGDKKTPAGDFGMLMAFGAKDDPGSLMPYTKLTDTMYLCGDKEYYNQFIDVSKVKHICSNNSEHLIRYIPQYNYAIFIDYNKEHVYGKGSAIFLHCTGSYPYTLGCVSVTEENMIKILKKVDMNARICIYAGK